MIKVEFNIWTWKDYKKWFWDKFCFPRRKRITAWLDSYASCVHSEALDCYIKSLGYSDMDEYIKKCPKDERFRIKKFEDYLMAREKMKIEEYVKLILMCK